MREDFSMLQRKKLVCNTAAALLTLVLATGAASAAFGTGVVTEGPLRMRAQATTSSSILATVSKGAKVQVLEDVQNGWYKVSYNDVTGYMSADYLNVTAAGDETAPVQGKAVSLAAQTAEAPEAPCARVDTSSLNVRAGAGTGFDKTGSLYGGSVVDVLSQADGWAYVEYGGTKGYVSTDYLTFGDREELKASSAVGEQLVSIAKQYLGTRYTYGGASPSGFDCSGFTMYVARKVGISLPHSATAQWNLGYTRVSKGDLRPGDLVFFSNTSRTTRSMSHVGIYVGGNRFIHSSSPTSGGVIISSMSESYYAARYAGACRLPG